MAFALGMADGMNNASLPFMAEIPQVGMLFPLEGSTYSIKEVRINSDDSFTVIGPLGKDLGTYVPEHLTVYFRKV